MFHLGQQRSCCGVRDQRGKVVNTGANIRKVANIRNIIQDGILHVSNLGDFDASAIRLLSGKIRDNSAYWKY